MLYKIGVESYMRRRVVEACLGLVWLQFKVGTDRIICAEISYLPLVFLGCLGLFVNDEAIAKWSNRLCFLINVLACAARTLSTSRLHFRLIISILGIGQRSTARRHIGPLALTWEWALSLICREVKVVFFLFRYVLG
jgi:hypothetical protein